MKRFRTGPNVGRSEQSLEQYIPWIYPPGPRMSVANEGLGLGNSGGDWNPGWGVDPTFQTQNDANSFGIR